MLPAVIEELIADKEAISFEFEYTVISMLRSLHITNNLYYVFD